MPHSINSCETWLPAYNQAVSDKLKSNHFAEGAPAGFLLTVQLCVKAIMLSADAVMGSKQQYLHHLHLVQLRA